MHNYHLWGEGGRITVQFRNNRELENRYAELAEIDRSWRGFAGGRCRSGLGTIGFVAAADRSDSPDQPAGRYIAGAILLSEARRQRAVAGGSLSAYR